MTSLAETIRLQRRRRRRSTSGGQATGIWLAAGVLVMLAIGVVEVAAGRAVIGAATDLPAARSLQSFFGPPGEERFRPAQLFDRTGTVLLAEAIHPRASERHWQALSRLPAAVPRATVAALDPGFWSNPGYDASRTAWIVLDAIAGKPAEAQPATITERLAQQTLIRADHSALAVLLLARDIASSYSKDQVLEWFLNSADYGNLAFGIDAAALVYFGKPADQLTLGEAALLAALPAHPKVDPFADPEGARALQRQVLDAMQSQGLISAQEAQTARRETLTLRAAEARQAMAGLGFVGEVWDELRSRIGPGAASQGGVRVVTTLDLDLQLQSDCVVRSYLARMGGGDPAAVLPAADGSPCAAASLLPPLRPGDSGVDHQIDQAASMLLDPTSGEVLAMTGPAGEPRPAGNALAPFVYLGAFSRGYTPATMIVDTGDGRPARGPMRLRTALVTGDESVTRQLSDLLGSGVVASTLAQMGIAQDGDGEAVRLDELLPALSVLADRGIQVGARSPDGRSVGATTIRTVYGSDGRVLYQAAPDRRSVTSQGLAFLLNDILADDTARAAAFGPGSPLEIGRPAAALTGESASSNWTVGYTPQVVAGAWVSSAAGGNLVGVESLHGAASIWHALIRFASRNLPVQSWPMPPEVTQLEVCDPSGYLPTPYCPRVVREVFLIGTEPTHADTLYRPFRINRETGRLATYFTPLDLVDEVVYFVPPPEAGDWARAAGLVAPPEEYDRIAPPTPPSADVRLTAPGFFSTLAGEVDVIGSAAGQNFASYRLDVGAGLDPQAWLQVGESASTPVRNGRLGRWDTTGLDGVYILRLSVVGEDGTIETTAVPVTVDSRPPVVDVVWPEAGASFSAPTDKNVPIQVEATDDTGLAQVVIYVDDRPVLTRTEPPWSWRWPLGVAGPHTIRARAQDVAGNWGESKTVTITVER